MKYALNLQIVGSPDECVQFLRLCRLIQSCGALGTHRKIEVNVDGDGSARLHFAAMNASPTDNFEELPSFTKEQMGEQEVYRVDIGE